MRDGYQQCEILAVVRNAQPFGRSPTWQLLHRATVAGSRLVACRCAPVVSLVGGCVCVWVDDVQEEQRIVAHGGVVKALKAAEDTEEMPARVFASDMFAVGEYSPGIAMSRSLGDALATELGVVAEPGYTLHPLCPIDRFVILATDGLWEVFTPQGTTVQGPVVVDRTKLSELCLRYLRMSTTMSVSAPSSRRHERGVMQKMSSIAKGAEQSETENSARGVGVAYAAHRFDEKRARPKRALGCACACVKVCF